MPDNHRPRGVRQLRLVVETDDLDAAIAFYRDTLGLDEELTVESEGGAKVVVLDAGRATIEFVNPAQKRLIDRVEAGGTPSPKYRVAFEVADTTGITEELLDAGATLLGPPAVTPWESLNARLEAPAGLQLTIFQELGPDGGDQPRYL
jgi:catechol 2,3-dioxygenase-like lactoylglutathione lyase family enzyme